MPKSNLTPTERFFAKVHKTDTCWLWTGCIQQGRGYGLFDWEGRLQGAHRVSWQIHVGPIPDDLSVLHNCPQGDNRLCVNPTHLFLGTQADNIRDRDSKRREARGERHGLSKLTEADVMKIRALYVPRKYPLRRLAREFDVHFTVIRQIIDRRTWTHLP